MMWPHRAPPTTVLGALVLAGVLGACSGEDGGPAPAVGEGEARDAIAHVVSAAARRTTDALRQVCADNDGCHGLSSSVPLELLRAPGPDQEPTELCTVALPATRTQAGPRLVVLEGTDGDGRAYVTQVLVDRADETEDDEDGLTVQEPGFWLGIRYTALADGRAWSGAGDGPGQPDADNAQAERACTDTDAWLSEVTARGTEAGFPTQG